MAENAEITLIQKTNRINELRSKMYDGAELTEAELQEGIDLVIEIRGLRAGKVKKEAAPKAKAEVDITELF